MPTPKLCEHNKVRSQCKQCGGTMRGICEHNRQRSQCKECGGGSICKHNRRRHDCKECGGASVCEHNRLRRRCKDCGGASICEHGRLRSQCKGCGGSSICEHNRQRSQCKDCRGSSFCEHSKLRCRCKQCGWLVQPAIKAITTRAQELESKGDWEGAIGAWDLFTNEAQKLLTRGQMKRRYCLEMQRTRQEAGGAQAAGDGKAVTLGTLAAMAGGNFGEGSAHRSSTSDAHHSATHSGAGASAGGPAMQGSHLLSAVGPHSASTATGQDMHAETFNPAASSAHARAVAPPREQAPGLQT